MKFNIKTSIAVVSILLIGLLILKNMNSTKISKIDFKTKNELNIQEAEQQKTFIQNKDQVNQANTEDIKDLSNNDKLSVRNINAVIKTIFNLSSSENTNEELIETLESLGLVPEVGSDKNEYTGELLMIRSTTEIPGVRYFHAQYFSNEDGGYHPQHISFNIPPRSGNFKQAVKMVKDQFKIDKPPAFEKDGLKHWELENGKAIRVQIMTKAQMKDNLWNAYDFEKDKGTVKVTIEDIP